MAPRRDDLMRANLIICNLATILLATNILKRKLKYKKRCWIREILQKREKQGYYNNLVLEMRFGDRESYFRFFRMSPEQFDKIVGLVRDRIRKIDTRMRKAITPEERLAVTLRYLASGDMQISLAFGFRQGTPTVSNIIRETCQAIWDVMSPLYVKIPKSNEEWQRVSNGFENMWNMPHCLGALDGKHDVIDCPAKSGSKYYNYKGTFSIVLMALCDSHYRFTMVDIGSFGSQSDGGIFSETKFGECLRSEGNQLKLPEPSLLPNSQTTFLYFFIGDEAFPLLKNMMRPYPGKNLSFPKRIYNYRLSRARRVIENTFGIMAARWRIFRRPINGKPANIDGIIKACVTLHNFMMTDELGLPTQRRQYNPPNFTDTEDANGQLVPGTWRGLVAEDNVVRDFTFRGGNRHANTPGHLRDVLTNYLCNERAVEWQEAYVNQGRE